MCVSLCGGSLCLGVPVCVGGESLCVCVGPCVWGSLCVCGGPCVCVCIGWDPCVFVCVGPGDKVVSEDEERGPLSGAEGGQGADGSEQKGSP